MIDGNKTSHILWQESGGDDVPEMPIAFGDYSNCLELRQDGNTITVNWASVPELIRALRIAQKAHERGE